VKTYPVKLSELTPDPDNARVHGAENLKAIATSLTTFGQRRPLVVRRTPEALVVVAGNGTLEAAKLLGWDSIVVTEVPEDWDEATARAYALADNRTAELATWDEQTLGASLLALEAVGYEPKALGFTPEALADVNALEPAAPDDEVSVVVGAFNTKITMAAFVEWNDAITAEVGEARADVEAEVGRRLGL
jgi:ParB-like chromosome segregation protein Spo0J